MPKAQPARNRRRVTLQAVADFAGVNRVTAAVALGQSPQGGTRVSETTRRRVLAAAEQLGYAPNALARALRGDRTNIIGYEPLDAHMPFVAAILEGLQQSCREYRQDLLLFGSFARDTVDSIYATVTRLFDLANYLLMILFGLLCLLPMIHLTAVSLSNRSAAMGGFVSLWPVGFTGRNYEEILNAGLVSTAV